MKNYIKYLLFGCVQFIGLSSVLGQVPNDECIFGTYLGFVDDYCSGTSSFTNINATQSADPLPPMCIYGDGTHDVWFSFVPTLPSVYISVSGLSSSAIALYEGNCTSLNDIGCNSSSAGRFVEISTGNVVIGQVYYIRVDARNDITGSFELCIQSFAPVPSPESDCPEAVVLCDKSPFQVENLNQTGNIQNELTGSCIQGGESAESGSVWYVWTCKNSGTLEFTLTPNNPNNDEEDLDFVVYELPGGLRDCDNRISQRCMLSGETEGLNSSPCYGATGLRAGEADTEEFAGCNDGSNNFVAPLEMIAGRHYGLIVNNFSQSGFGFGIEWGGTGTFLGPEADFTFEAVDEFDCDKTIVFTNASDSQTDPIVNYTWNFGADSGPSSASGPGPHATVYESFGDKLAGITVETQRGCVVTHIEEFFVQSCCDDLPSPIPLADVKDVSCFGLSDGSILASATSGQPAYQFSLDGINFQPSPLFIDLPAGDYTVYVQDIKGCVGEEPQEIFEPEAIKVDAGQDTIVDLGYSVILDADYNPMMGGDILTWDPTTGFIVPCESCLEPEIISEGTTTYTLTVTDDNGCTGSDDVTIRTNVVRSVFTPNVFSPNGDLTNEFFNIFGGPAIRSILNLWVYDRWGNLVYEGSPTVNDHNDGWDGTFNGTPVENGVYAWIANIQFIDSPEPLPFSGDVTVLK